MAIEYDEFIIQQHARSLYESASALVWRWTILTGAAGGYGTYYYFRNPHGPTDPFFPFLAFIVCAIIGYSIGNSRAFSLRLQAQMALCQAAIERNTRNLSPRHPAPDLDKIRPIQ